MEPTTFKILESAENREVVFTVRKMGVAVRDVVVSLVSIGGTATSKFVTLQQNNATYFIF